MLSAENAATQQIDMFHNIKTTSEVAEKTPARSSAEAFVRQHYHPPSSVALYDGIPTEDARSQVVVRHNSFHVLDTALVYPFSGGAPTQMPNNEVTGYAFLCCSGVRVPAVVFVKGIDPATGFVHWYQDLANTRPSSIYNFDNFYRDAQLYRPAYRSLTTYANVTAFNNTGSVCGYQFNPAILFAGTRLEFAEKYTLKFAKFVAAAVRAKHIDIADDDETICHWLRYPKAAIDQVEVLIGPLRKSAPRLDPDTLIQLWNASAQGNDISGNSLASLVPTQDQIVNASVRAFAGMAKDGTFTVQRLNTIAPRWLTASNTNPTNIGVDNGLYECWVFFEDSLGNYNLYPFNERRAGTIRPLIDTLWTQDMTWSWVVYDGMTPNPTFTTSATTVLPGNLIIFKSYIGYEVQPALKSAYSGLERLGPMPNIAAMQQLMQLFFTMKDCAPASSNFWGALGKIALQALPHVAGTVIDMFNKPKAQQTSIPYVPPPPQSNNPNKRNRRNRPLRAAVSPGTIPARSSAPLRIERAKERNVVAQMAAITRRLDNLDMTAHRAVRTAQNVTAPGLSKARTFYPPNAVPNNIRLTGRKLRVRV